MNQETVKKVDWPLVLTGFICLFTLGLLDNARGPFFADITRDLSLTDTQASLFFAVTSLVAFFSGRVVPRLVKYWGLLTVVRFGLFLLCVGFASISLAGQLAALIFTCAIFGYGFGLINVVQNLLVIKGATGAMRRQLLSGLHGMYAFSALLAPLIVAQFFRFHISWREAFVYFALMAAISFVSTFFVEGHNRKSVKENVTREPQHIPVSATMKKQFFIASVMTSLYAGAEMIITTRLPLYLRRDFNYTPELAAGALGLFFLFLLLGRLLFLFCSFKISSLKIVEIGLASSLLFNILGLTVHPLILSLCGLSMAPVFGVSMDYLAEKFDRHSSEAIVYALAMGCVFMVSTHFILGVLSDRYGIHVAMTTGAGFLIISFIFLQLMKRDRNV